MIAICSFLNYKKIASHTGFIRAEHCNIAQSLDHPFLKFKLKVHNNVFNRKKASRFNGYKINTLLLGQLCTCYCKFI